MLLLCFSKWFPRVRATLVGLGCLALGIVAEIGCPELQAGDWPIVRGNVLGTGVAEGKLPSSPKVLWEFKTGIDQAGFEGTPVIADGRVFLGDFIGHVYAIDLKTGQLVWKVKEKDGFLAAGCCSNGILVMGDFSGNIFGYKMSDGTKVWSVEIDSQIVRGGNLIGEDVLLSTDAGSLIGLELSTGKEKWKYATGDQLNSTASIWKQQALLGGCDSRLHQVDLTKGTPLRESLDLGAPTLSTPNIIGDIAIVPTQPGNVYAIRIDTGETLWSYNPDQSLNTDIRTSSATLAQYKDGKLDGIVVVPSRNRRLLGLDASNGKLKWEAVLRKRAEAAPVVCDGRAWIGGTDGMIYSISLVDGKETWSYQMSGQILASPAVAENRLIIASEKGSVVCFGE